MRYLYVCPICGEEFIFNGENNRTLSCKKGHCFDLAKTGYANLLLQNKKNSKLPGDNKLMVDARKNFLDGGFYKPLCDEISKILSDNKIINSKNPSIFDAGCGEGYYTVNLAKKLSNGTFYGADISKTAVLFADKRANLNSVSNTKFFVGSIFRLPISDGTFDASLNIFAPFCREETLRILKKTGRFIMVIPAENHLFSLKEKIYDNPYFNEPKDYEIDGFSLENVRKIEYKIALNSNEQIQNLFKMTPYYYKTSEKDQLKLDSLDSLETEVSFEILIYKKG